MFFLLIATICGVARGSSVVSDELAEFFAREHFKTFEATYNKAYESLDERESRFLTFLENLEEVVVLNANLEEKGLDKIHGVTKFSDWTKEEFKMMLGVPGEREPNNATKVAKPTVEVAPTSLDWRDKNVVTPVKDQGRCGSCWAHSATETLESRRAMLGLPLEALSVQELVSCDATDQGCGGGWYYTAWEDYIKKNGGLASEKDYPYDEETYAGKASKCRDASFKDVADSDVGPYEWATAPCKGIFCKNQDEETLKKNLASYGPLSIACDASQWSSYAGGVLTQESCARSDLKLDHAIQLVGYNEDAEVPYWIVRNSWNTDWGLDGYIHIAMGSNTCGIADKAATVSVDEDAFFSSPI